MRQTENHHTNDDRWAAIKTHIAEGDRAEDKAECARHHLDAGCYLSGTLAQTAPARMSKKVGHAFAHRSGVVLVISGRRTVLISFRPAGRNGWFFG
jgi:hypothetical protein